VTSKSRKRLQDLESRICAIAAQLENQARNEWMAALSDEKLERLVSFMQGGISADTPIPPDVLAILQTLPRRSAVNL
jgi:hypothetical protein